MSLSDDVQSLVGLLVAESHGGSNMITKTADSPAVSVRRKVGVALVDTPCPAPSKVARTRFELASATSPTPRVTFRLLSYTTPSTVERALKSDLDPTVGPPPVLSVAQVPYCELCSSSVELGNSGSRTTEVKLS